jgi:anaerobic selenocysteine-containing dehydrogenase
MRRWTPSNWASPKPFGIGEQRPNNYREIAQAIGENRDKLGYAWRILNHGVCDGCSLGTAGLHDWTLDGVHLCNIRLRLLRLNTMGPFADGTLDDVEALRARKPGELRELGRIPYPLIRLKGDRGFRRASWNEALDLVAAGVRDSSPATTASPGWSATGSRPSRSPRCSGRRSPTASTS